jgi:hypothetical protein
MSYNLCFPFFVQSHSGSAIDRLKADRTPIALHLGGLSLAQGHKLVCALQA